MPARVGGCVRVDEKEDRFAIRVCSSFGMLSVLWSASFWICHLSRKKAFLLGLPMLPSLLDGTRGWDEAAMTSNMSCIVFAMHGCPRELGGCVGSDESEVRLAILVCSMARLLRLAPLPPVTMEAPAFRAFHSL